MLNKMCNAVANPVALPKSPVNKYVQNIVNSQAVNLYVSIRTTVLLCVSVMIPLVLRKVVQIGQHHYDR